MRNRRHHQSHQQPPAAATGSVLTPTGPTQATTQAGGHSEQGRRDTNEDRCFAARGSLALGIVADGCGGVNGGDVAAQIAVDVFERIVREQPEFYRQGDPETLLREGLAFVNQKIRKEQQSGIAGPFPKMCCAAAAVAYRASDGVAAVAGIGDTVGWIVAPKLIQPLTRMESKSGVLLDAGLISEAEAMTHPDSNVIFRALGLIEMRPQNREQLFVRTIRLHDHEAVLLTSDGVHGALTRGQMLQTIDEAIDLEPAAIARRLTEAALASGSTDNATAVLVAGAEFRSAWKKATERLREESRGMPMPDAYVAPDERHRPPQGKAPPVAAGVRTAVTATAAALALATAGWWGVRLLDRDRVSRDEGKSAAAGDAAGARSRVYSPRPEEQGSIAEALREARDGDVVQLSASAVPYREGTLRLSRNVRIVGAATARGVEVAQIEALESVAIESDQGAAELSNVTILAREKGIRVSGGALRIINTDVRNATVAAVEVDGDATPEISYAHLMCASVQCAVLVARGHASPSIWESTLIADGGGAVLSAHGKATIHARLNKFLAQLPEKKALVRHEESSQLACDSNRFHQIQRRGAVSISVSGSPGAVSPAAAPPPAVGTQKPEPQPPADITPSAASPPPASPVLTDQRKEGRRYGRAAP